MYKKQILYGLVVCMFLVLSQINNVNVNEKSNMQLGVEIMNLELPTEW